MRKLHCVVGVLAMGGTCCCLILISQFQSSSSLLIRRCKCRVSNAFTCNGFKKRKKMDHARIAFVGKTRICWTSKCDLAGTRKRYVD